MNGRILLTLAVNIAFAWAMYLYGWNDMTYRLLGLPLILGAALLLTALNWAIWNLNLSSVAEGSSSNLEKRKHERIDSVLRDLSDEDLLRLRRRLNDGTINDEILEDELIGEDGELLRERR